MSQEPLYSTESNADVSLSMEEEYFRLPWYSRLWYFIKSLFKSKPPIQLYEEQIALSFGKQIEAQFPGLYDYRKEMLLPLFYNRLLDLKGASRFFYTALDLGFNKNKGAFYAFLGSLEMPSVHTYLQTVVDPAVLAEQNPETPETEMRSTALRSMDDALKQITEEQRGAMYNDTRSLLCLKELSSFLFDRLLVSFSYVSTLSGYTCDIDGVKEMLLSLNNVLFSLKRVPPMPLLESLFIFLLQEREGETSFDIHKETQGLLTKAEEALVVIREFNQQVPITKILRCVEKNSRPKEISGGEDWFMVYREYWKHQIEDCVAGLVQERNRLSLLDIFDNYLKGTKLEPLNNTISDSNPDGFPLKGAFGLSFLLAFYSAVFINYANTTLKIILVDGDFIKRENRVEFNESYNNLLQLQDKIRNLEKKIAHSGEYEKRLAQARQDMSSLQIKRRKIQIIFDETSTEAIGILEEARNGCRNMINILKGIIGADATGKYSPLSNAHDLSVKNSTFVKGIGDTIESFQKAIEILDNIDALEAGDKHGMLNHV